MNFTHEITPLSIVARLAVVRVTLLGRTSSRVYWLAAIVGPDGHHTLDSLTHDSVSLGVDGLTLHADRDCTEQNFIDAARDAWTHWARDVTPP